MTAGYSVKNDGRVVIWLDAEDTPGNLVQPTWPDGTEWADKDEAEDWAKAWLAYNEDPDNAPQPGNGPDLPLIPSRTVEEVEEARAAKVAEIEESLATANNPTPVDVEETLEDSSEESSESTESAE